MEEILVNPINEIIRKRNLEDRDKLDESIRRLRQVYKGLEFLGWLLPEYPHEGGLEETTTFLGYMAKDAEEALNNLKEVLGYTAEEIST